jgi:hypothetical protein
MRLKELSRNVLLTATWLILTSGIAHAHGGMAGPDELGPPVGMSVAIGLACYYVITLWPRRGGGDGRANGKTERGRGR